MIPVRAEAGLSIKNVVVNKAVLYVFRGCAPPLYSDGWKPRYFCDSTIKSLCKTGVTESLKNS